MRTPRVFFLALIVLLAVASAGAPVATAGWWDDLDRGQAAKLGDVVAQPSRYRGRFLSIFCIYHRTDKVFAPLAAPYNPTRHENVAVWEDGAPVWEKGAYAEDYPFLYIDKANPHHAALVRLEPFTRIEVTGRIHGQIRSRPCLEIRSFRVTGHRVGETVIRSVMAGDRYAEAGKGELAYENYRRALRPDLPPSYEMLVRKRVAESLRRLGRSDEAQTLEGGRILGGSSAPEAQPPPPGGLLGDPLPGTPGTPAVPAAEGPGARPFSRGPDDLPGAPALPRSPSSAAPQAPRAPTPFTEDLPGTPQPFTRDLPGSPGQPALPPIVQPSSEPEAPKPAPRVPGSPPVAEAVPPAPPPAGAPARQAPRLTGVK